VLSAGARHWHVLGAGAMGCLFAHALHRAGCQVTLVLREASADSAVPVVVDSEGERRVIRLDTITPASSVQISRLLVTTKTYAARAAVAGVAHLLRDDCAVLLLTNGMGLAEQLGADLPHSTIYSGTTTEGAYTVATRHTVHAGHGETRIGRQGQCEPASWFEDWARAIPTCVWDTQIDIALWKKLAVNCVINPLTAVHRCHNGELAARPEFSRQVKALCAEVANISRAAGFGVVADTLEATVGRVIAGTANNHSSMLQDVLHGRPTEIDYITGYLLQVAASHGIAAPCNRALLEKIKTHAL